jgi:undecaprenyl-diphosphatase
MDNFALNIEIFRFINSHHVPAMDTFFRFVRVPGAGWLLLPVLLFACFYRKNKVLPLLIAVSVQTIVVAVLKRLITQPRPAFAHIGHVHLLQNLHKGSFPSGDVAVSAVIAIVMCRGEKPLVRLAWYLYIPLIAYERMYLGVHFPLDVTVGAAIGILCSYLPYLRLKRTKLEATETEAT